MIKSGKFTMAGYAAGVVLLLHSPAHSQLLGGVTQILEPVTGPVVGSSETSGAPAIEPLLAPVTETVQTGTALVLSPAQESELLSIDSGGSTAGSESNEVSPLATLTEPAGESLAPLVQAIDTTLDPVTDPVDAIVAPVVEAIEPVVNPITTVAEPLTFPVEGVVQDLTGGSLEDSLTTSSDQNTGDGDGVINDLLLGGGESSSSSQDLSPIEPISAPAGESLAPLIDTVDTNLDPLTNPVDSALAPVVETLEPVTSPVLAELDPVTSPVDGVVSDLTGGSATDALTTSADGNTADGDGVVNDVLGGGSAPSDAEVSPVPLVSEPLGGSLAPLVDTVDTGLDAVTDPVDAALAPVVEALEPATTPVLDTVEPITNPVDGLLADTTGGSLEDALTTTGDTNSSDGDGVINDLLGGSDSSTGGSPVQPVSEPAGASLEPLVGTVDTLLDPITDAVDQALAPVVETLEPVTEPVVDGLAPVIQPVDAVVGDLTGGSVSDALTTTGDGNTSNGDGLVNDLLGGDSSSESAGDPTAVDGLVGAIDTTLDPITDPVDGALAPVVEALEPVTQPVVEGLAPVIDPVDAVVGGVTGGSVSDALTTTGDGNTGNGDGLVNDLLGSDGTGADSGVDSGSGLAGLVDVVDTTLDPITDPVDGALAPVVEALEPVTQPAVEGLAPVIDPVDAVVGGVTGGSVSDALTTTGDGNTGNGDGLINDLLGSGGSNDGSGDNAGSGLGGLVDVVDTTLDPITDPVDGALAPVVEALEPVTQPVIEGLAPVIEPIDGVVGGLTGGSVSDALTTTGDGNTGNGDGLINDLLGSGSQESNADQSGGLAQVVDVIDTVLDPITDPVDGLLEPLVEGADPAINPVLDVLEPIFTPADGIVGDVTGGSLSEALTPGGDGLIGDLLGSNVSAAALPGLGQAYGTEGRDQTGLQRVADQRDKSEGCRDGDGDKVCDEDDLCPMSAPDSQVLANGCDLVTTAHLELEGVRFATNSAELNAESYRILARAIQLLQQDASSRIVIAGHADSRGSDAYNDNLSLRRARAVAAYLVGHGIDANRLEIRGYGERDPVASTSGEQNNERNRRAILLVSPAAQTNAMVQ